MKFAKNIILNTDSYKCSMFCQYPPNTTGVFSYIEARGAFYYDSTLFFGLQGYIKEYLLTPITQEDIDYAEKIILAHGEPFNREGWEYILKIHNGYLPIVIKAVKEGSVVPTGNVLVTIENTDPNCFWLTTWLETSLLRAVWFPTTVSTISWNIKKIILAFLEKTGDPTLIDYKLHDFGFRGVSSFESSAIGAAAHLVNFKGTDTISGILYADEFYNSGICGFSIPAMEHSTVTSWGRENEVEAYRNMLKRYAKPNSIIACVSDSYDVYNAAERIWGEELRQEVIDSGAIIVIRPDSGDPVEVCTKLVNILGEKFGYTFNSKGYKVLNYVRLIQGDGVNETTIWSILDSFKDQGWSADNISFGMGGALLQQLNRDTLSFAMKCSAVEINGEWRDVKKDPVTDLGKRSKAGRVMLYKNNEGNFFTSSDILSNIECLETVYKNGKLLSEITFDEVRINSEK